MYARVSRLLTDGPAKKLEEIVRGGIAAERIKLADDGRVLFDFCTDEIDKCNTKFDVLQLVDIYTEKYLLAYTANEG